MPSFLVTIGYVSTILPVIGTIVAFYRIRGLLPRVLMNTLQIALDALSLEMTMSGLAPEHDLKCRWECLRIDVEELKRLNIHASTATAQLKALFTGLSWSMWRCTRRVRALHADVVSHMEERPVQHADRRSTRFSRFLTYPATYFAQHPGDATYRLPAPRAVGHDNGFEGRPSDVSNPRSKELQMTTIDVTANRHSRSPRKLVIKSDPRTIARPPRAAAVRGRHIADPSSHPSPRRPGRRSVSRPRNSPRYRSTDHHNEAPYRYRADNIAPPADDHTYRHFPTVPANIIPRIILQSHTLSSWEHPMGQFPGEAVYC